MLLRLTNATHRSQVRAFPERRIEVTPQPEPRVLALLANLPGANVLQSPEWGAVKRASGWESECVAVLEGGATIAGAQVLFNATPLGTMAYVPRGPIADLSDRLVTDQLMTAIVARARERGAIGLRVEPNQPDTAVLQSFVHRWNLQPTRPVQPRSTLMIDMSGDPSAVWDRLSARTRYNVRLAGRRGVQVLEGEEQDLPLFHAMLCGTGRRAGFAVHSLEYFEAIWRAFGRQGLARLLFARHEGKLLSAGLDLVWGTTAYHLYAASAEDGREHKPNELVQWELIRRAHCEGAREYDLWGIPDEIGAAAERGQPEPEAGTGGLWGVYGFKRGFGGKVVRYAGAFDLPFATGRHRLWRATSDQLRWLKTRLNASASAIRRSRRGPG